MWVLTWVQYSLQWLLEYFSRFAREFVCYEIRSSLICILERVLNRESHKRWRFAPPVFASLFNVIRYIRGQLFIFDQAESYLKRKAFFYSSLVGAFGVTYICVLTNEFFIVDLILCYFILKYLFFLWSCLFQNQTW